MASTDAARAAHRAAVEHALSSDADPLAAYEAFVKWTLDTRDATHLTALLKEATHRFKDDAVYKSDLRYLRMWSLYATRVPREKQAKLYRGLVKADIGVLFAQLWEEFASVLERDGHLAKADEIYRMGISKNARPLDRIKKNYASFQARHPQFQTGAPAPSTPQPALAASTSSSTASISSAAPPPSKSVLSRHPPPAPGKRAEAWQCDYSLIWDPATEQEWCFEEARARSLGLLGKKWAPLPLPAPAPRVRFGESTGGRHTASKRRSMGPEPTVTINTKEALQDVFGMFNSPDKTMRNGPVQGSKNAPTKKVEPVTPLPMPALVRSHSDQSVAKTPGPIQPFIDQTAGASTSATPAAAKTPMAFRPFVDASTTPAPAPALIRTQSDENAHARTPFRAADDELRRRAESFTPGGGAFARTPHHAQGENAPRFQGQSAPVFTPFVDRAPAPVFTPFVDNAPAPVFTPAARPALAEKTEEPRPKTPGGGVFSRPVFTPRGDVFSAPPPGAAFTPFADTAETPFKVFARPGANGVGVTPTPTGPFRPSRALGENAPPPEREPLEEVHARIEEVEEPEEPAFSIPVEYVQEVSSESSSEVPTDDSAREDADDGDYSRDFEPGEHELLDDSMTTDESVEEEYDVEMEPGFEFRTPEPEELALADEMELRHSYQQPLRNFGAFAVMTPVTERTFEYTMNGATPGEQRPSLGGLVLPGIDEGEAFDSAGRLADELREQRSYDGDEDVFLEQEQEEEDEEDLGIEEATASLVLHSRDVAPEPTPAFSPDLNAVPPCDPFEPSRIATLMSLLPSVPGFHDMKREDAGLLAGLQKYAKKAGGRSSSGSAFTAPYYRFEIGGRHFGVYEKLGEGGFGAVFAAKDLTDFPRDEDDDEDDDEDAGDEAPKYALKVVRPRNVWEYHVLHRLHAALPEALRSSIVSPHALYACRDESFLVLDLCAQGTLLDMVNRAPDAGISRQGACMDELLVFFFAIELLRAVAGVHAAGFVHGDLKIDNCLIRLEPVPGGDAGMAGAYRARGEGGWRHKGVKLIDFGRTIDTRLFPPGQTYVSDWKTDARDCPEMREGRPWTFQPDYYGLADIVYCMLFGKYIDEAALAQDGGRVKLATPLKRYWQVDIWSRTFDLLLNPTLAREGGELPLCEELDVLREEMEAWLEANSHRSAISLKSLLTKVQRVCETGRR